MSDLTERLAAKLYDGTHFNAGEARMAAKFAKRLLPLLLSEPELVASMPDEVRRNLLLALLGGDNVCDMTSYCRKLDIRCALDDSDEVRLSVLTPRERAVMKLGEMSWAMQVAADAYVLSDADESGPEWDAVVDSQGPLNAATAEVAALTPEVPRVD